ncbi:hypothetical protein E6Q11_05550 [Candidatus Dojkabacteria bacterium]|uniref:Uncharacterized protein n=1 Tax=Candidatus Dojkabacteria bacterium TaxID=2099670 RepID=A0A5C7J6C1_9BACT|nr:MAG: hypothetical protein E6Q11_05550 [Candidatus Dojkabacteria bacterium]
MKSFMKKKLFSQIKRNLLFLLNIITISTDAFFKEDTPPIYEQAVIKETIAEMSTTFPVLNNQPISPQEKSCSRAHQGLYNELVNCLEEKGDQIKIFYNNVIYGFSPESKKAFKTFWVLKKHIVPLKLLSEDLMKTIPSFHYAEEPTVVLIYPWKNFSVGTRFQHLSRYDTKNSFVIKRTNYDTNALVYDLIPKENAIQELKQNSESARKLFVKIINDLIDRVAQSGKDMVIPYVWGGSSFVEPYAESAFFKKDGTWHREGKNNPYSGYDCAEFVMKMAKIAGIDFPWKTTTTIERNKRALTDQDTLEEGDLIWIEGHIMIISNIACNEIIEARGYKGGYGSVQRIRLSECFDEVSSYDDLLERYFKHKTIRLKNKQGIPGEQAYIFKLLKLVN